MLVSGSCHCGRIGFRAEIDPATVSICYCTDCQVLTGSAFRVTVPASRAAIRLAGPEPRRYVKIADNGIARAQLFCPDCGTPLFACDAEGTPAMWSIRWGAIHGRDRLRPRRAEWCRSAPAWVDGLGELPGLPTE